MKENKDFWKRIDRLEELAGKATQGEWNYCGCEIWANETTMSHDVLGKVEKFEDAQYIDAANPTMIQEMITELRKLERENAELRADNDPQALTTCYFAGRMAEGREKNREMDKLLEENKRLEKEADWLATILAGNLKIQGIKDGLRDPAGGHAEHWREAARKAVVEADNA